MTLHTVKQIFPAHVSTALVVPGLGTVGYVTFEKQTATTWTYDDETIEVTFLQNSGGTLDVSQRVEPTHPVKP